MENRNDEIEVKACAVPFCSQVELRHEIDFSSLPKKDKITRYDGIGCVIPSGARLEVWRIKKGEGLHVIIRNPMEDGNQSVLPFGLTREAARALHGLLDQQLYPEHTKARQPEGSAEK